LHLQATSAGCAELIFRPEVALWRDHSGIHIGFALWQVDLPLHTLEDSPDLARLFTERRIHQSELSSSGASVATLLDAQGCFLPPMTDDLILRDVLALIQPLFSKFYADYYAHPIWGRLRCGDASKGELIAWVIHNYHISRSAGVIAARMATNASCGKLQAFFRTDALEEFWHCDSFYFVESPELSLDTHRIKAYVPLPASTAFEDLALRAADEDWLGHLLIAYFQESSIIFREDSERFYDTVEENYRLGEFFRGWRQHMSLDVRHRHAEGLKELFSMDQRVSLEDVIHSMRRVQFAHYFLSQALDQISQISAVGSFCDSIGLRQPASMMAKAPTHHLSRPTDEPADLFFDEELIGALRDAALRSLAFARSHDEIIAAGRLVASIDRVVTFDDSSAVKSSNPWVVATRNFLIERSTSVSLLIAMAREILQAAADFDGRLKESVDEIRAERHRLASLLNSVDARVEIAQLAELIKLSRNSHRLPFLILTAPTKTRNGA
jgi:hypothetical protein